MNIEGNPRNCTSCDFLVDNTWCRRFGAEIKSINVCPDGPMIKLPQRGQEMSDLMGKVELAWRVQGERKVEILKEKLNA